MTYVCTVIGVYNFEWSKVLESISWNRETWTWDHNLKVWRPQRCNLVFSLDWPYWMCLNYLNGQLLMTWRCMLPKYSVLDKKEPVSNVSNLCLHWEVGRQNITKKIRFIVISSQWQCIRIKDRLSVAAFLGSELGLWMLLAKFVVHYHVVRVLG